MNDMTTRCIIEIGANLGTSTQQLYEQYHLPIIAIEPTPELVKLLWDKFAQQPDIHVLPFAIDVNSGFRPFYVAGQSDWGCSSLYEFNPDIASLWPNRNDFKYTHQTVVPCITGKQLIELFHLNTVEYLWIDAQGNDFRVLQSFGDSIDTVMAGRCEAAYTVDLYSNTKNSYVDICSYLHAHGFKTTITPDNDNKECDIHFSRA